MWRIRGLALVIAVAVALGLLPGSLERPDGTNGSEARAGVATTSSSGSVTGRRWE